MDGTGSVDKDEFSMAMSRVDPSLSQRDMDVLFDAMDLDGDKEISFIEFVAATVDPREVLFSLLSLLSSPLSTLLLSPLSPSHSFLFPISYPHPSPLLGRHPDAFPGLPAPRHGAEGIHHEGGPEAHA